MSANEAHRDQRAEADQDLDGARALDQQQQPVDDEARRARCRGCRAPGRSWRRGTTRAPGRRRGADPRGTRSRGGPSAPPCAAARSARATAAARRAPATSWTRTASAPAKIATAQAAAVASRARRPDRRSARRGTTCATGRRAPAGRRARAAGRRSRAAPGSAPGACRTRCPGRRRGARRANAGRPRARGARGELGGHLGHHVVEADLALHRRGLAAQVAEDSPAPRARGDRGERRVVAQAGDVVHDARAGVERRLRDARPCACRSRARAGSAFASASSAGHDARDLLGLGHRLRAGPRRLAADVEHVGAGREHRLGGAQQRGEVAAPPSRRKRPPSENESGVTFSTPTIVTRPRGKIVARRIAALPRDRLGVRQLALRGKSLARSGRRREVGGLGSRRGRGAGRRQRRQRLRRRASSFRSARLERLALEQRLGDPVEHVAVVEQHAARLVVAARAAAG